jgi:hypothetical protein
VPLNNKPLSKEPQLQRPLLDTMPPHYCFAVGSFVIKKKLWNARVGIIEEVAGCQKWSIHFEGEAQCELKASSQSKHMTPPSGSPPHSALLPIHIPFQAPTVVAHLPPQAPSPLAPAQQVNAANSIPDEEVDFVLGRDVSLDDSVDNEATPNANKEEAKPINGAVDEEPAVDIQVGEEDVADQAVIIGDLEQEDVHKTKWVKYITDKEKLIHDGFSVQVKATKPSLAVGVQVHEVSQLFRSFYNA